MKWFLTYLFPLVFALSISLVAKSQDDFTDGINAYNQKEFALAVIKFEKVIQTSPNNTSAWYNLGLSNLGLKQYGEAIWNFEKVLKYVPNDNQVEEKIEYCYNQLYPELVWQPRLNPFESSLYSLSPNTWAAITIVLSIICAVLIIFYFIKKQSVIRNIVLTVYVFFICCFISSVVISAKTSNYYSNDNFAVVTEKSIPTFIEKSATSKIKITEGHRVEITEHKKNGLVEVKTSNGKSHVVRLNDLSII